MRNIKKILKDPFYSKLYIQYGFEYIIDGGYFDDSMEEDSNIDYLLNIPTTPILKWKDKIDKNKKQAILLTSGSFCPIHKGHFDMMEKSKIALNNIGIEVLCGYISPSHDEYINSKNKEQAINVFDRIDIIQKEINLNYDWLCIEPWEGIFNSKAINFTEVTYRLKEYIKHHTGVEIPVYFVFGGDNANFAKSFKIDGNCVVVNRPNYETKYNQILIEFKDNTNVIFTHSDNDLSSTKVRQTLKHHNKIKNKIDLNLRITNINGIDNFSGGLFKLLKEYFNNINIDLIENQKKEFEKIKNKNELIISIDPFIKTENNIEISRNYDYLGFSKLGYVNRPNSLPLLNQISKLDKNKKYILFDDDICSGNTMRYVTKLLIENNIKIDENNQLSFIKNNNIEVIDSRDFLLGSDDGGLVINNKYRLPYIYPYVYPYQRSSIKDKPLEFSIEIWKLNKKHYKDLNLKIKDVPNLIWLNEIVGLNLETNIVDVCDYHIKLLHKFI